MSKFLQRLHKEVLDSFPFSISGYDYPDREYENFFNRICKFQESLEEDSKIHFTISGFAKLKISSGLGEAELDKWETESLKYLLFNDNYLGFPEPILSLYIILLQNLTPDKRIVNILAENVNNSILIKIVLNENLEKIRFSFIKSDNTLLIEVPISYFKYAKNGKRDSLQDLFKDISYDKDLIVTREKDSSSYSIALSNENYKKVQKILNEVLELKTINTIASHRPENVYDKLLKEVLKNENYIPRDIYSLIFASSILCYFYECSLTYFVSTARVANNKKYTLGAMGIGLRNGNDLTDNDKALYTILVNHIAANLSTQLIYENNKQLKREANKLQLRSILKGIKEFHLKAETPKQTNYSNILHGSEEVSEEFDMAIKQYITDNRLLTHEFLNYYNSLKAKNNNYISKYCLVTLTDFCRECKIRDRCNVVLKLDDIKCCQSSKQIEVINLPLLDSIVNQLVNRDDIVTCSSHDDEIIFEIQKANRPFNIKTLQNKLLGIVEYGDFTSHISNNFEAIDCHGILSIYGKNVDGKYIELFHSRNTVIDVHDNKFVLNKNYIFPNQEEFLNIQLKFKNEL